MEDQFYDKRIISLANKFEASKKAAIYIALNRRDDLTYYLTKLDSIIYDENWLKQVVRHYNTVKAIYNPNKISFEQSMFLVSAFTISTELDNLEDELFRKIAGTTGVNLDILKKQYPEDYFTPFMKEINLFQSNKLVFEYSNDLRYLVELRFEMIRIYNLLTSEKGGCYIATMTYGAYDHPQVILLRQFRDNTLQTSFAGRLFVKVYYRVSPIMVSRFKGNKSFNRFSRFLLDFIISRFIKKDLM